jgi:hypothetical protein
MSTPYQVVTVPLTAVVTRQKVIAPANGISSVTVLRLPAGSDVALRLGQSGDPIPVDQGDEITDLCPPENDGLYLDINVASPADTIVLAVFSSSAELSK